ncbi:hypothetical protein CCC_00687 [Paramagnetospirillum magnetotacticum MS-1]|uniref:Uncharacterized protein n=1 Tax=Paramagnetospirillum magnetotacticum MS-1 TaxID=272627 RepID=A0A0C2UXU8_PARME|nr:hypothetical protein CCC_00687 [Paramagnetospirillum magnetotacticum MS-1]
MHGQPMDRRHSLGTDGGAKQQSKGEEECAHDGEFGAKRLSGQGGLDLNHWIRTVG